ncbi:MAG: beta-ketoacyl-ACP synthase II [Verrucomicrobia bacterium]|nr:beta-ketoacyl-ACP synthase II [Verrucomicrobiota bacterium]
MAEKRKRIVITGIGMVSCFGSDPDLFYDSLLRGESGVKPITEFEIDDMPTKFAAWAQKVDMDAYVDQKQQRRADPYINYTIYSGKRALEQAGLLGAQIDTNRAGVIVGSGMGGMDKYYEGVSTLQNKGVRRVSPFFIPYIITNMGSGLLAAAVDYRGPNYSISTACATGTHSIVAAANHLILGDADVMLAGGVEASKNRMTVAGFVACHALSERNDAPTKASRPWDIDRDGFVIGEGCAVFVLETLEHCLARGAEDRIIAEYLGGGASCDAYHMTNLRPDGAGIALCIEKAIAHVDKERVNYINCHATSTRMGDMAEIVGIQRAFGEQCKRIKINGTKSMTGHCLGGAGAVELVATIKALERKKLHPTINLDNPEPDLNMDPCAHVAQDFPEIDICLKNSFGFGGHNACIAVGRYQG